MININLENIIECGKMDEMNPVIREIAKRYLAQKLIVFYIIDLDDEESHVMVNAFREKYCPNLNIYLDELVRIYFLECNESTQEFWRNRFIVFVKQYEPNSQ